MIIKDNNGHEYTLTSTRLAEVCNPIYYNVFSVTAAHLKKALKIESYFTRWEVEFDFKPTNMKGRPLPKSHWRTWSNHLRFPFSTDMTQIGCALFSVKTAALISKMMGLNVRQTTRG